jgi:hypothetical protein
MTLAAGLLLAGLSAAVSQVGFLLPHRGAVAAPDVDMHHPLRSATGLFRSNWWTVGYALAVVAYLLHVGAPPSPRCHSCRWCSPAGSSCWR